MHKYKFKSKHIFVLLGLIISVYLLFVGFSEVEVSYGQTPVLSKPVITSVVPNKNDDGYYVIVNINPSASAIDGYKVFSTESGRTPDWTSYISWDATATTTRLLSGYLTYGKTYDIRVRSYTGDHSDPDAESDASDPERITISTPPAFDTPELMLIGSEYAFQVKFKSDYPDSLHHVECYYINYKKNNTDAWPTENIECDSDPSKIFKINNINNLSRITKLTSSGTYQVRVYAVNNLGHTLATYGINNYRSIRVAPPAQLPPNSIKIIGENEDKKIQWTRPPNYSISQIVEYLLQWKLSTVDNYEENVNINRVPYNPDAHFTEKTYTELGLLCEEKYSFRISARNSIGSGEPREIDTSEIQDNGCSTTTTTTTTTTELSNIALSKNTGEEEETITITGVGFTPNQSVETSILNKSNYESEPECDEIKNSGMLLENEYSDDSGEIYLLFDVNHDDFRENRRSYICAYHDENVSNVVMFEILPSVDFIITSNSNNETVILITTHAFYGALESISINDNQYRWLRGSNHNNISIEDNTIDKGYSHEYSFVVPKDLSNEISISLRRNRIRKDLDILLSENTSISGDISLELEKSNSIVGEKINWTGSGLLPDTKVNLFMLNKNTEPSCNNIIEDGYKISAGQSDSSGNIRTDFRVNKNYFTESSVGYICAISKDLKSDVVEFEVLPSVVFHDDQFSSGQDIEFTAYNFYGKIDEIIIDGQYEWNDSPNDDFEITYDKDNNQYKFTIPDDLIGSVTIEIIKDYHVVEEQITIVKSTISGDTSDIYIELEQLNGVDGERINWKGSGLLSTTKVNLFMLNYAVEPSCDDILEDGYKISAGQSDSSGNISTYFKVDKDNFEENSVGYICATNKDLKSNVINFEVLPSIEFNSDQFSSGEEVEFVAYNFYGKIDEIIIDEQYEWNDSPNDDFKVTNNNNQYKFTMPDDLIGEVIIEVSKDNRNVKQQITIVKSTISLSRADVRLNELIILSGSSFPPNVDIDINDITIDGHAIIVTDPYIEKSCAGSINQCVKTDSTGQLNINVRIWPKNNDRIFSYGINSIDITTVNNSSVSAVINISRPEINVLPKTVAQSGEITVEGEYWPIGIYNDDQDNEVIIKLGENSFRINIDEDGEFIHRIKLNDLFEIDKDYNVTTTHHKNNFITDKDRFTVSHRSISVEPKKSPPGGHVTISVTDMPRYAYVEYVKINNRNASFENTYTDGDGNATIRNVFVRDLDPGIYPVNIQIGDSAGVSSIEILPRTYIRANELDFTLPEVLGKHKDIIKTIFYFDNIYKKWLFYDTRDDIEEYSTLKSLENGEVYWVEVTEPRNNITINHKTRNLTCVDDFCWNMLIW